MKRYNLYMFRCGKELTKQEMAAKTGVSRVTYTYIESGKRFGSAEFWDTLQSVFCVPDEEMRALQKLDQERV